MPSFTAARNKWQERLRPLSKSQAKAPEPVSPKRAAAMTGVIDGMFLSFSNLRNSAEPETGKSIHF